MVPGSPVAIVLPAVMTCGIRFTFLRLAQIVRRSGLLPSVLIAALWMAGCVGRGKSTAATGPAKPGATAGPTAEVRYRVSADTTSFYRYGPQQINGPDQTLKKGTDVIMVKHAFGYSTVRTFDTQLVGYVSTEDLRPLTQPELAALVVPVAAPSAPLQTKSGKKSSAVVGEYNLPAGAGAQEPLPEAPQNTATPPPNNMFRY